MRVGFIDWTEHSLTLYIFEKRGSEYSPVDSSTLELDGEPDTEKLRSLPAAECDSVYLSIPVSRLTLREQTFPFSDRDKIRDTLPFELEGMLLGNVGDYSIDHIIMGDFDVGSQVLAVCLEKSRLRSIIDLFSSSDLEPKVITCLDLRLSEGDIQCLLNGTSYDADVRAGAVVDEIKAPMINLRQNEFAYMGDVLQLVSRLRTTAALVLVLLTIVLASYVLNYISLKKEQDHLNRSISEIYHEVFPEDRKIIDAARQFKGNMQALKKKHNAMGGLKVLDTLLYIAKNSNSNIKLHEFNAEGSNIIIKGTASAFENVESLKDNFSKKFSAVKVTESEATLDKKINFTIVMQEKVS